MMSTRRRLALGSMLSCLLCFVWAAPAVAYTDAYFFGDSHSDTGNNGCGPSPYYLDRCSNGPVWSETFASSLGLSAITSALGGTNFAVGGDRSVEMLSDQVPDFLASGPVDPGALYVFWVGPNDLLRAPDLSAGGLSTLAQSVAENIAGSVSVLSANGATEFLVLNMLDLGRIPLIVDLGAAVLGTFYTNRLNSALSTELASMALSGLTLFDAHATFEDLFANPGAYGISNTTTPCRSDPACVLDPNGPIADTFAFFDALHPTTAVHDHLAASVYAAVVPEPSTGLLFATGLVYLASSPLKNPRRRPARVFRAHSSL